MGEQTDIYEPPAIATLGTLSELTMGHFLQPGQDYLSFLDGLFGS
jgi:hypothetical protein